LINFEAKKRLKDSSREGDSKLAKKARKLADEASATNQRNSILKHVKTSLLPSAKPIVKDIARK
jgi:hypothetical protein